jgi:ethanolamine permease
MLWLTWAAIGALICFCLAVIPGVSLERVFTTPLLPGGWSGVLGAVPYALWWLVSIETVALASEEAHEPHITIPRGLVFSQITLVGLVILTWFFACAAAPYKETGAVVYPLPLVFQKVWGTGWFLKSFSAVAMAGLIVSYSGMIYATSRQCFSLGRAGYLPRALGDVHGTRRTPQISLIVCTLVTIVFIVFGQFYEKATAVAILISTLAAVIWYMLAMVCLFALRRKEPGLFRPYLTPVFPWMPVFVAILSAFSGYLYVWANVQVIVPAAILYAVAGVWYLVWGRKGVLAAAPEEVAARIAAKLSERDQPGAKITVVPQSMSAIEHVTAPLLVAGILSLVWMVLRATNLITGPPFLSETLAVTVVWALLFILVSVVGLYSTKSQ